MWVIPRGLAGKSGFFDLTVAAIGKQVVGVACTHDAGAGQRQGHAGGVDSDPAAAPLLGDVGGGAGAAGRVEDEVAWIGGHHYAALDDLWICFDHISFVRRIESPSSVVSR